MRDLLYAALLQSDNVAADALADFVGRDLCDRSDRGGAPSPGAGGPSRRPCVRRRDERPRPPPAHGPHPLPQSHRTRRRGTPLFHRGRHGALDPHALDKADFRFFIAQKDRRITLHRAGAPSDFLVHNTNQLLGTHRIDGVKTGSTTRAGECLILSAARDPIVRMEGTVSHITPTAGHRRAARFGRPFRRGRGAHRARHDTLRRLGGRRAPRAIRSSRSEEMPKQNAEVGGETLSRPL